VIDHGLDKILQTQLDALESGTPLEKVLADLPVEAGELAPLIRLAAAIHELPDPNLPPDVVKTQHARIVAAANLKAQRKSVPKWFAGLRIGTGFQRLFALAAFTAILAVGIGLFTAGPAAAHYANLVDGTGVVEVASTSDSSDWHQIRVDEKIRQGERVRTHSVSEVTLEFFDGSRTTLGPNSDMTLTRLDGRWGNTLQVQLTQTAGTTSHDVIPLRGASSFFRVDTASGQANVQGTRFNVIINKDGGAFFAVTHGKVQVKNSRSEVTLDSGQMTAVLPGQDPENPAYQFSLGGKIESNQMDHWIVSGVLFAVTPQTDIQGLSQTGETVFVQGHILGPGAWVADLIKPIADDPQSAWFAGVIEGMPDNIPGEWIISGQRVLVDQDTALKGNLQVGSAVGVTFTVISDQSVWTAKEIAALDAVEENETLTPTIVSTATETAPSPTQTNTATPTITVTPTVTGTIQPKNETSRCDNRSQQQPEGLKLAQQYKVSYDEIMGWFCKGFGFGEIDQAYSLSSSSGQSVHEIFAMRSSGQSWGTIKKKLIPTPTHRPKDLKEPKPQNTRKPPPKK